MSIKLYEQDWQIYAVFLGQGWFQIGRVYDVQKNSGTRGSVTDKISYCWNNKLHFIEFWKSNVIRFHKRNNYISTLFYEMSFWMIFRLLFHKKVVILCHQIIKEIVNTNYVNRNYEALLSFSLCKVAYRNTAYLVKEIKS